MTHRKDIEEEIQRRADKTGRVVDWKELALRLLEWQSNLYPGQAPTIIQRSMKKPRAENDSE